MPRCDALYVEEELSDGETARCLRCGTVLARPRAGAFTQIIALAVTTMVLMVGAIFFPSCRSREWVLKTEPRYSALPWPSRRAFSAPLAVSILGSVVALPALRAALLSIRSGRWRGARRPYRLAAQAFRLSEKMKPWSMAEIFIIGTAVAMVKIGGLATVSFGPAF